MKNNLFFLRTLCLLVLLGTSLELGAQTAGDTPCTAINLYPSAIGDCNNSCGQQLCGEYQCEQASCGNNAMPGTATIDGSCTPDNDIGQACTWLQVTATAADIVIENNTNFTGPGAANIERKDYTIFSGTCSSLTEVGCSADVASGSSANFSGLTVGQTYFIQVTRSQTSINQGCPTCNSAASCVQSSVPFTVPNNSCSSPVMLVSGSTINTTNANAAATDPSVCQNPASGSVENNTWYQWCSGPSWVAGDTAFVHVFGQTCNNPQGLQMSVYDASTTCASINAGTATSTVCENPGTTTDYNYFWVANPNECFFVMFDGFAGTACNFNIQISNTVVLLQNDLLRFEAENRSTEVILNWEIEQNSTSSNTTFVVERSNNAIDFHEIAITNSQLNDHLYSVIDDAPLPEVSYYRLKMIAANGDEIYSKIIAVTREGDKAQKELYINRIYPQPTTNNFTIDFAGGKHDKIRLKLVNALGQQVFNKQYAINALAPNSITIEANQLQAGIYTLILEDEFSSIARWERIIKQ